MGSQFGASTGYGPMSRMNRLLFDGDEEKYEAWEEKFLGYMLLKDLKSTIIPPVTTNTDGTTTVADVDPTQNEKAYAELIQFLDDTSLQLVMRDAKNDGKKALEILRAHYSGKGKSRLLSLYTELMLLTKSPTDTLTEYILKAEKAATAIKNTGEELSDSLLIAVVLKGLPDEYTPFSVHITQTEEDSFANFKTKLRSYEETEKTRGEKNGSSVMMNKHNKFRGKQQHQKNFNKSNGGAGAAGASGDNNSVNCYGCAATGHKTQNCELKKSGKLYCSVCKTDTHSD